MKKEKNALFKFTLTLPHGLAREAEAKGLLMPQALESLLRAEIRRRRVHRLFNAADQLSAIEFPPMTDAEVEAEIQAARTMRRSLCES
ncbi:MAG: hypothetical protein B1H02_03770 [Candidatus Latescibacteria bacterium 4484_107]|nr:MAG: hypothetical protein B1H02_03770 [Candidatus Latescibacteria bacterium 4484_107]